MRTSGPVAVYRHFDASGDLLYIGQSNSPSTRPEQLCRGGADWAYTVSTITVEWFPDRQRAMAAEALAIKNEAPRHNIALCTDRAVKRPKNGGKVVRLWLSQNGMADTSLAAQIGKPVAWVRKVLNDEIRPSGKSLGLIERVTGISPLVFCRGGSFPRYAHPRAVDLARAQLSAALNQSPPAKSARNRSVPAPEKGAAG